MAAAAHGSAERLGAAWPGATSLARARAVDTAAAAAAAAPAACQRVAQHAAPGRGAAADAAEVATEAKPNSSSRTPSCAEGKP